MKERLTFTISAAKQKAFLQHRIFNRNLNDIHVSNPTVMIFPVLLTVSPEFLKPELMATECWRRGNIRLNQWFWCFSMYAAGSQRTADWIAQWSEIEALTTTYNDEIHKGNTSLFFLHYDFHFYGKYILVLNVGWWLVSLIINWYYWFSKNMSRNPS